MVFDDLLLKKQNTCEKYYIRGRHSNVDTFYLTQNYFKLPRQTIRENANFICLFLFMQCAKHSITDLLKRRRQTKVKMVLCCKMKKTDIKTGETIERDAYFHSNQEVNLESTDVDRLYDKMVDTMMERKDNFQRHGSNWRFVSVLELEVHMVEYIPLKGSSWIELPEALKRKGRS